MRKCLYVLLAFGAASCSSSTSPKTSGLTVTVHAPTGLTPVITITGPNGYKTSIQSTEHLTGLAPGSYTITAAGGTSADPVVATIYQATVTGSPAAVSSGAGPTVTVTYAARAGTGGLWVVGGSASGTNTANTAMEYVATQLLTSTSTAPVVKLDFPITTGGNIDASGVAFDAQGNLWVVNDNSNTVVEYTVPQLIANGSPTPAVTIQLPSMSDCYAIAFDANGNLWVGNNIANTIVEFTPSQLATSGSPTPTVTITEVPPQGALQEPIGLAFDGHGNLWVANNAASSIVEYTPNQLATSGSPTPAVTLTGSAIAFPNEIAFDHAGNLWITNSAYDVITPSAPPAGRIVEYAAKDLTATGTPTAVVTLNPPPSKYGSVPTGIAFDDSGNLWYADAYAQSIGEYSAASLTAGGSPSPAVIIPSATAVSGVGIAFNPHTTGLPLH